MIAAVQLRGAIGARQPVKDTLRMLHLGKKHACVLLEENPQTSGMLRKCKDFITYGEVTDATAEKIKKILKGRTAHLHPPRGGLKSIKRPFGDKGDLGNRGKEMDALIGRMLP